MVSSFPFRPVSLALMALLLAMPICSARAQAPTEFQIVNSGRPQAFLLADDEVSVVRAGAGEAQLKREIESRLAGATAAPLSEDRVLVRLPARLDRARSAARTDALSVSMPGAKIAPVLYLKGRPRDESTQRIVSEQVLVRLKAGTTAEQLGASVGATAIAPTNVADHVLLSVPSGFHALEAAASLRVRGFEANPQLLRKMLRKSIPNDPFFANQWHLLNVGQSNGQVGVDVKAPEAWNMSLGKGVTIAIVDDCLQLTHPDFKDNVLPLTLPNGTHPHHNFNGPVSGFDAFNDPAPGFYDAHGTSCGGVAAARGNNGIGVSGSAPEASLLGLRLISGFFSDSDSADALYWHPAGVTVGVSSNSWGPYDDAHLEAPDILTKQALADAATLGRGGKGTVTVWAGGNGLQNEDNVNLDGFANSRFVIAVGAVTNQGQQSYYSERGSPLLVSAPSNGGSLGIFTTDVTGAGGYNPGPGEPADNKYTNSFGGTSSATPLVSGGVALLLAANPALTYRDVQEILAGTAQKIAPADTDWVLNGGGFKFNHKFGGGVVDLSAALVRALDWKLLPAEISQSRSVPAASLPATIPDNSTTGVSRTFDFSGGPNLRVEHVEVVLNISHAHRSDLEITLSSPEGTLSTLIERRARPDSSIDDADYTDGSQGWTFMSTHHWGENSTGTWTVRVRDLRTGTAGSVTAAAVRLFGTPETTQQRVIFDKIADSVFENAASKTVRIRRVGALTGAISVDYATSTNGSAVNGADFTAISGTAQFADGQATVDVELPILDDLLPETAKTIFLVLKNPVGAALGGATVETVKVVDDDANFVSVVASDSVATETAPGATADTGTFVISRAAADILPLTVIYSITGTAQEFLDFNIAPTVGRVTIPSGATSATVTIRPVDNIISEVSESVILTLQPDGVYTVGLPNSAEVTIVDNDLPTVQVSALAGTVPESGGPVSFRVSRAKTYETALTVELKISGSARSPQHYAPLPNRVEIPAGAVYVDVPMQPIDDTAFSTSKNVVLSISTSADYAVGFSNSAKITITENDPLPDTKLPGALISAPAVNARINAPEAVLASGTAGDNGSVTQVRYRLNGGAWKVAAGTTAWNADITTEVAPGPNLLEVLSLDEFQNESAIQKRAFAYVKPHSLSVSIAGSGTVSSGFAPTSQREAGQTYTISATAASGSVFAGWSGGLSANARSFTFVMPDADTALEAAFVANPFAEPGVAGAYLGVVQPGGAFEFTQAGLIQLKVLPTGAFSGSLVFAGTKYPLKGEFTANQPQARMARFVASVARKSPAFPLQVELKLDAQANGTGLLAGSVSTPDFASLLSAGRQAFNAKSNPYQPAKAKALLYTVVLPPPAAASASQPHGNGFATLKVDASGVIKWSGTLGDGTKFSQASALTKTMGWPIYVPLYGAKGVLQGNAALETGAADNDLAGTLDWSKPALPNDKLFPAGFVVEKATLLGSLYTPPDSAHAALSALEGVQGTIAFEEGNLQTAAGNRAFSAGLSLSTKSLATLTDLNATFAEQVKLKITTATGLFSGTFIHPLSGKSTAFGGVLFQRTQSGFGGFPGSNALNLNLQTGRVLIEGPAQAAQ